MGSQPCGYLGYISATSRLYLGKWGPNLAVDLILTREHPVTRKLQVLIIKRSDAVKNVNVNKAPEVKRQLKPAFDNSRHPHSLLHRPHHQPPTPPPPDPPPTPPAPHSPTRTPRKPAIMSTSHSRLRVKDTAVASPSNVTGDSTRERDSPWQILRGRPASLLRARSCYPAVKSDDESEASRWAFPGKLVSEKELGVGVTSPRLPATQRGVLVNEKLVAILRTTFIEEAFAHDGNDPVSQARVERVKDQLSQLSGAAIIYAGCVDDPRNTDNAWIETTAVHIHCPFELGVNLNLAAPGQPHGVTNAIWQDVDLLKLSKLPLYAQHQKWIERVIPRIESRHASLASIIVRWGRLDIAERVLHDAELVEQRSVAMIHPAFQEAMHLALSKRDFNVKLIDLLITNGACASECNLAKLFSAATNDPFLIMSEIRTLRENRYNLRSRKLKDKVKVLAMRTNNVSVSLPTTTKQTSALRSPLKQGETFVTRMRQRNSGQHRGFIPIHPRLIELPEYTQPVPGEEDSHEERLMPSYPVAQVSPWHEEHVEVLERYLGAFRVYASSTRHTTFFDLIVCAICCGASDLAHILWTHCESPLRVALLCEAFTRQISHRRFASAEAEAMRVRFEDLANGVLEGLDNVDTRRKVLTSRPQHERLRHERLATWRGITLLGETHPPKGAMGLRGGLSLGGITLISETHPKPVEKSIHGNFSAE